MMNFIFIMSDSFRFDNLGCYSKMRPRFSTTTLEVQTPHLDAFASRCTIFDHAYVGSFPTIPNRRDILTGKMRPFNIWKPLGSDESTMIADLVQSGYLTQMFTDTYHLIKDGFNYVRDFNGWDWIRGQEFDRLSSHLADQPINPETHRIGAFRHTTLLQQLGNQEYSGKDFEEQRFCAQTMSKAIHWLERNYSRPSPFFLYVDTFDPHEPWHAPQWYEDLYDPDYKGEVCRFPKYGTADIHTKESLNHIRALYAAEVTLVDRWIGRLLETIEYMNLMENTCIVFVSDHGFFLGEHNAMGKLVQPLYEEITHIPMLIHMPGQKESRHVSEVVQPADLTATILELSGAKTEIDLQGVSLCSSLEGKPQETRPYAFTGGESQAGLTYGFSISSAEWTLVYPRPVEDKPSQPEMHHLPTDPMQQKDVLADNAIQARVMWDTYAEWLGKSDLKLDGTVFPKP